MHVTRPALVKRSLVGVVAISAALLTGCAAAGTTASPTPTAGTAEASPTPAMTPAPPITASPVTTADWTRHVSQSGVLGFSYDPGWNLAECDPGAQYSWGKADGPATTILLGLPAQQQLLECPVEDESPQILISSTPGTPPQSMPSPFPCVGTAQSTSTAVVVQGVSGMREESHFSGDYRCIGLPAISEVEYFFATNGRVYDFDYSYRQGDATDLTAEFDQLVMSTLMFSAA